MGGLGAALAGSGMGLSGPATNGGHTNGGRQMPAWYDLTGAGQGDQSGPGPGYADPGPGRGGFGPSGGDPLPQRRPWGDESDGPAVPRQGWGEPPPGLGGGGFQSGPPPGYSPAPGFGAPPAPAHPPAWPPVAEDPVRGIPERLSASLDMTSEMSRARGYDTPAPPRYGDDMTQELPIFTELESAWFSTTSMPGPEASAGLRSGVRPSEGSMSGAMRSSGGAGWSDRTGEGAPRSTDEVSWRTHADDGWRAAQAAMDPQDGGTTDMGLPRRVPMAQLVPGGVDTQAGVSDRRSPESVRGLLSAYTRGVQRGRDAHGDNTGSMGPYTSREQEA
jgi:hypothetical protein